MNELSQFCAARSVYYYYRWPSRHHITLSQIWRALDALGPVQARRFHQKAREANDEEYVDAAFEVEYLC